MKKIVSILLAVMLLVAVIPTAALADSTKTVYVSRGDSSSRIYFRSGAGYDYPEKGVVYHMDKVSVQDSKNGWSKIKVTSTKGGYRGYTGWIRTYYVDGTTQKLCTGSREIKTATKVYASPKTSSSKRGSLSVGEAVKVYYFERDFAKIIVNGSGLSGWIPMRCIGGEASGKAEAPTSKGRVYHTTASTLNVRSGPGTGYKVINKFYRNTAVYVLEKSGNWSRVRSFNGATGWVSNNYLSKDATGRVATRGGRLNVRTRASSSATILGSLNNGTRVTATNVSGNWAYIIGGGLKGWSSLNYLRF